MKLVCDACQSKYSISDDKVRGKVFKIRCKKCSNVIVVRGGTDTAPPPDDAPAPAAVTDDAWYAVIDQAQIGPLAADEIARRHAAGEIDAETYLWREDMPDWLPLAEIPQFTALVAVAPTLPAQRARAASPVPADEAGDLFGGPPHPAAASADQGRLRGERNESSVLFSLNKLTELAAPPRAQASAAAPTGAAAPLTEGSGLIDIRSMASAYLGPNGGAKATRNSTGVGSIDDLPVFAGGGFSEPAVLVPVASRSTRPRLLYAAIGASALVAIAAVVVAIVVVRDRPASAGNPQVAQNEARHADGTGASADGTSATAGAAKADGTSVTSSDPKTDGTASGKTNGTADAKTDGKTDRTANGKTNDTADVKADGKTDRTANGKTNGAADAKADGKTDAKTDGTTDAKTDAKTDGRADGKTDGKVDGKTDAGHRASASHADTARRADANHADASHADAGHRADASHADTAHRADAGHRADASHADAGHGNPLTTTAAAEACDQVHCMVTGFEEPCCARFKQQQGSSGNTATAHTAAAASGLPEKLDRSMIKDGVGKVMAKAQACGNKSSAKGTVRISVKVDGDGHITSTTVRETPDPALGSCVETAMKQASFAKTQAGGSFAFPFVF